MYRDKIPEKFIKKWQVTVDLMMQFFDVPAALINRFVNGNIQIEVSGEGEKKFFNRGDSSKAATGHYCDEVYITGKQVHVKNAYNSKKWAHTPKNTKGMVSYLGSPVKWPDNSIFGTLCVLDLVERDFDPKYLALINQFTSIIESDLVLLSEEMKQIMSNVESEKRYKLLADNAEDVIWTFDLAQMKFEYISPSIERLRGYTVEEAMEQTMQESLSPEAYDWLNGELENRLVDYNEGEIDLPYRYRYEVQQPCKDGSLKWVEMFTSLLTDDDGKPTEIFGVSRDITDRKKIEDELVRAKEHAEESDRLKTAFLTNMSHEIRTPLNGLVGFSQILVDPNLDEEQKGEYADIINKSAQQLLTIVNKILEISRVETGQVEISESKVNLNKIVDEVSLFFSVEAEIKKLKIKVRKGLEDDKCEIISDPFLLKKILENLVDNAIKFTDQGEVILGYEIDNEIIKFFVQDTGIGVSAGNEEIIFERFIKGTGSESRQFGGNGLGLSVSKAYSEKLGGKIYYKPSIGVGAKFIFELPLQNDVEANPAAGKTNNLLKKVDPVMNRTVLVVEDEEYNYIYTEQILKRLNATVIWAKTGNEAIEAVRETPEINLVLMDIKLPDISGYEVTKLIMSEFPDMKVIAFTAYALAGDRETAINSGCIDYISKPAKADTMIGVISKYC